jgi:sensor histidine kinase YesM
MRRIFSVQWLFAPLICLLMGFYSIAVEYFVKTGVNGGYSALRLMAEHLYYWCFWAILSPLILIAAKHFPLERPRLGRSLLFHIPVSVFCPIFLHTGFFLLILYIWGILTGVQPSKSFNSFSISTFFSVFVPNVIIYYLILALNLVVYYQQKYQNESLKAAELNAQLSGARLQALKMQLHPHFLFNTLHSITALVLENESRDAVKMIKRLSEFLRVTLDSSETQTVTLKDELEFAERYLGIELIRFQNRLTVERNIDPLTLDAEVPNLILQPLVENAVRHGIAARSGACRIDLVSQLCDGQLYLEVSDEGGEKLNDNDDSASEGGVGLQNTVARLRQLYGEAGRFNLFSENSRITTAQIIIPFIKTKQ